MNQLMKRKEFSFLWTSKAPFKTIVAARGSGKTVATLQYVVERLLKGRANGSAVFFSSTLKQVKFTIEPTMRLICQAFPKEFVNYNKSYLTYRFRFNSTDERELILLSYENEEKKRGLHPQTIVLDECASMSASMYGSVILPMLNENDSELIAIGTPQGQNKFYELYKHGISESYPEWESFCIKASKNPNLFDPDFLFRIRNNLSEAEYAQEYECDFDANVLVGSVYGEFLRKFTEKNIDDSYDWNPSLPVYTAWDLGFSDYCAIWFFQVKNDTCTFIDYYENNGNLISFYADELNKMPYVFGTCFIPHDGAHHNVRGAPIKDQLMNFGYKSVVIPKDLKKIGIDKARELLQTCRFNKTKCALGLQRLYNYKFKIDKQSGLKMAFTDDHDESSHGADAFRYAAQSKPFWNRNRSSGIIQRPRNDFSIF